MRRICDPQSENCCRLMCINSDIVLKHFQYTNNAKKKIFLIQSFCDKFVITVE
jgi:hypothetical protein